MQYQSYALVYDQRALVDLPGTTKPREADYSNPRAWTLVHLLNTMGGWIEKVIATRLLYYAVQHELIPLNQFGAMPGGSIVDAAICMAHGVHASYNHNLCTSLLTFDITDTSTMSTDYNATR